MKIFRKENLWMNIHIHFSFVLAYKKLWLWYSMYWRSTVCYTRGSRANVWKFLFGGDVKNTVLHWESQWCDENVMISGKLQCSLWKYVFFLCAHISCNLCQLLNSQTWLCDRTTVSTRYLRAIINWFNRKELPWVTPEYVKSSCHCGWNTTLTSSDTADFTGL